MRIFKDGKEIGGKGMKIKIDMATGEMISIPVQTSVEETEERGEENEGND